MAQGQGLPWAGGGRAGGGGGGHGQREAPQFWESPQTPAPGGRGHRSPSEAAEHPALLDKLCRQGKPVNHRLTPEEGNAQHCPTLAKHCPTLAIRAV